MTLELFIFLVTVGSTVSSLITESIKKIILCNNIVLALIVGLIVGLFGSFIGYILLDIAITLKSVIYAFLVSLCVGGVSQVGYDKVIQLIRQIGGGV